MPLWGNIWLCATIGILLYFVIVGNTLELVLLFGQQMKILLWGFCFASCYYREYFRIRANKGSLLFLAIVRIIPEFASLAWNIQIRRRKGPIILPLSGYTDMCQYRLFQLPSVVGSVSEYMPLLGRHMNMLLQGLCFLSLSGNMQICTSIRRFSFLRCRDCLESMPL